MADPASPAQLRAQAAQLRQLASELEASAAALELASAEAPAQALDLAALRRDFGFSRESLASAARDGLPVHRGPRSRLLAFRSDVEAWIRSRAWAPSTRRAPAESDDGALARAEAELLALDGRATRPKQAKTAATAQLPESPPHLRVVPGPGSSTYGGGPR